LKPTSALPGHLRRALAALCAVAVLSVFVAPAPAAVANEPVTRSEAAAAATTVTLTGENMVFGYLTPTFSPAKPQGTLQYEYLRDGVPVSYSYLGTDSSYLPQQEDFGARISARITVTVDGQEPFVLTSAESAPVRGYLSPRASGTGEPILGTTMTVSANATGWPALQSPAAKTVTWFRDWQPIPGATAWLYIVTEADLGSKLTATVEFSAADYVTSKDTVTFGTAFRGLTLASEPVVTYATGTAPALPGTVLKTSTPAVREPAPAGMTYTYQWGYSSGNSSYWIDSIPGATSPSYTVRTEDIGRDLRVTVTPVAPGYTGRSKSTAFNMAIRVLGRFTPPSAPTIKGTAMAGQLLTAVPGTAPSPAAESVQYVWYRDGQRLTEHSTDPTYRLTRDDGGHKITVRVFYGRNGYVQASSPASAAVLPPGYFTSGPAWIVGSTVVGYVVSARTSYTSPSPSTALYQWYRDGKPIIGARGTSYRLTAADQWRQVTFKVTFKRANTVDLSVISRAIKPLAVFTKLPAPVVRGTHVAGQLLRASVTLSTPAATSVTWQWMRDGKPIAGATGPSYLLTRYDRDRFVHVVATYRKANYLNSPRPSALRWVPGPTTV
jgi:hypothetical protein